MEYANKFDSTVEKMVNKYLKKPQFVYGIIILFLALYAAHIAPTVPHVVAQIFDNTYFKLFIMILILWIAQVSPSLSILIAVAFMMISNYANNRALFEMLDNTAQETAALETATAMPEAVPVTPLDSVNAINNLTLQAMSPEAGVPEKVQDAVVVAVSTMAPSDQAGREAVVTLATEALKPTVAETDVVADAMKAAIQSINNNIPSTITTPSAVEAVQVLADSAASEIGNNVSTVQTAANMIAAAIPDPTPAVIASVESLVEQAVTPAPSDVQQVTQAAQAVVNAIVEPVPSTFQPAPSTFQPAPATTAAPAATVAPLPADATSGCYPVRSVDMSKVTGEMEGHSIEDYQTFTPSM
jgi:hypothetical protein